MFFCIVLLCILVTSSKYFLFLLVPYHVCPLLCPFCMQCCLAISNFLEKIPRLPILLFSSISLHWSLRKAFLSLLLFFETLHSNGYIFPFLLCLSLLFFFSAICKASSDNHFAFLHFFFFGMILITASCTMSWTSVHSSSGTLSDLIPWIYLSLLLYNRKEFYLGHTWMV